MFTKLNNARHLDGIIISRTLKNDPRIDWLKKLNIPFVAHGRCADRNDFAWYDVDNHLAYLEMTNFLVNLGHRDIAKISGPNNYNFVNQRISGYKAGLSKANINFREELLVEANLSLEGGKQATYRLFKNKLMPSAISCVSDIVAIGCIQALGELGLKVGVEVSVVGYDGLNIGEIITPKLTTMTQSVNNSGKRLASILFELIDGKDPQDFQELSKAKLILRETAQPLNFI